MGPLMILIILIIVFITIVYFCLGEEGRREIKWIAEFIGLIVGFIGALIGHLAARALFSILWLSMIALPVTGLYVLDEKYGFFGELTVPILVICAAIIFVIVLLATVKLSQAVDWFGDFIDWLI